MARIPQTDATLELLVNCKTYPAISTKYVETVCTGGVQSDGSFVRLYPIQFRFLDKCQQYRRWDVIRVRAYRDTKDSRPESWHLIAGTDIAVIRHIKSESQRWDWMRKTVFESTEDMETKRRTNGCVEIEPIELYWTEDKFEWTPAQKARIACNDFFLDSKAMKDVEDRVPYQFRLKYKQRNNGQSGEGKVLAWSYYEGFQRGIRDGLSPSEAMERVAETIRKSIFNPSRIVFGIFGTHSRFGSWMLSSLYHVPSEVIANNRGQYYDDDLLSGL